MTAGRERFSAGAVSDSLPVALVTGASRGIGRAIAVELGRTHHVLVGGRDAKAVGRVVAGLPSATPFVADLVTGPLPVLPERLDVLVHSAGIEDGGRIALLEHKNDTIPPAPRTQVRTVGEELQRVHQGPRHARSSPISASLPLGGDTPSQGRGAGCGPAPVGSRP